MEQDLTVYSAVQTQNKKAGPAFMTTFSLGNLPKEFPPVVQATQWEWWWEF